MKKLLAAFAILALTTACANPDSDSANPSPFSVERCVEGPHGPEPISAFQCIGAAKIYVTTYKTDTAVSCYWTCEDGSPRMSVTYVKYETGCFDMTYMSITPCEGTSVIP